MESIVQPFLQLFYLQMNVQNNNLNTYRWKNKHFSNVFQCNVHISSPFTNHYLGKIVNFEVVYEQIFLWQLYLQFLKVMKQLFSFQELFCDLPCSISLIWRRYVLCGDCCLQTDVLRLDGAGDVCRGALWLLSGHLDTVPVQRYYRVTLVM